MARHRDHHRWRIDRLFGCLVCNSVRLLRSILLLFVLQLPEMLRQLLWVLRSSQGQAQQVSRRTVYSTKPGVQGTTSNEPAFPARSPDHDTSEWEFHGRDHSRGDVERRDCSASVC